MELGLPAFSTIPLSISWFPISEWSSALFHGADHIGYGYPKINYGYSWINYGFLISIIELRIGQSIIPFLISKILFLDIHNSDKKFYILHDHHDVSHDALRVSAHARGHSELSCATSWMHINSLSPESCTHGNWDCWQGSHACMPPLTALCLPYSYH